MNIQKTQNNNVSFGFNFNTHRKITQRIIEREFPELGKYAPELKAAVIKPDFKEIGLSGNNHFYYPVKSLLKPRESFLDFDGSHNARAKFNKHIDKFFDALNDSAFPRMLDEVGRAKHYLDDVCVGLHVQRGNFLSKLQEMGMHKAFENFIYRNEDKFIENSQKTNIEFGNENFDDIFMSVVNYMNKSQIPNSKNVVSWAQIAQNSINIAMDASRVFFSKFLVYLS